MLVLIFVMELRPPLDPILGPSSAWHSARRAREAQLWGPRLSALTRCAARTRQVDPFVEGPLGLMSFLNAGRGQILRQARGALRTAVKGGPWAGPLHRPPSASQQWMLTPSHGAEKADAEKALPSCCVRAASGHAAAAPPSSVMNSRRVIRSPRRRSRAAPAAP